MTGGIHLYCFLEYCNSDTSLLGRTKNHKIQIAIPNENYLSQQKYIMTVH